jgi:hypothetical protein
MKQLLCHEYVQRHSLKIPLVLYPEKSNVILRHKTENIWRIFSLHWRVQDYHPSFYEVNYFEIIHNGLQNKKYFKDIIRTEIWNWDQYESNMLSTVKEIKNENFVAKEASQNLLSAWSIFVYLADSCLANKFDYGFFEILNQSLYNKLPVKKRLAAFYAAEEFLKNDPLVWEFWNHRIKPISSPTNSKWLIELINE